MSQQAAYPLPQKAEEVMKKVNPTGTSHTLTVTVNDADDSVEISTGSLEIKNGDKVIWNVILPTGYSSWKPTIQFNGKRFGEKFSAAGAGSGKVEGPILGEPGANQNSEEPYSVLLEKNGSPTKTLKYKKALTPLRTFSEPEPLLVIDDIGDPTMDPGSCDHHWGYRRNRQDSK